VSDCGERGKPCDWEEVARAIAEQVGVVDKDLSADGLRNAAVDELIEIFSYLED